jgi:hypothetical protein
MNKDSCGAQPPHESLFILRDATSSISDRTIGVKIDEPPSNGRVLMHQMSLEQLDALWAQVLDVVAVGVHLYYNRKQLQI